jgi:hypothetical protein
VRSQERLRYPEVAMKNADRRWAAGVLAAACLLAAPGCVVRSVHSWLKSDSLTFEEDLLGGWVGTGMDGKPVAMTFLREDEGYVVQYSSGDGQGTFLAVLGKFGGDYFLDFTPKEGAPGVDGLQLFPTHTVARLELGKDRVALRMLGYGAVLAAARLDRLRGVQFSMIEEKGKGEDKVLLFTSTTEEMQRFVLSLDRSSELWEKPIVLNRTK